jgi:signal transduction histidine kinase
VGTVESVDLIGLAAEECARIDADLEMQTDGPLEVQGIAKLLRRAVRNLLENARRYSEGEITLSLSKQDGMALIRVEDHGPGVPKAQRERIFEVLSPARASERSGGVGWACRWCVRSPSDMVARAL